MKLITSILGILLFSALAAVGLDAGLGLPVGVGFMSLVVSSVCLSFIPMPSGLRMGLLVELWTGELIKKFRHENSFLSRIVSKNEYVNNNAINLVDVGADPTVLINNTTYPIDSAQRTDVNISIALDKFDTTNTIITDDELYALPYDKEGSIIQQHRETLEEKTQEKAIHSLCPQENTANTPVGFTTGASDGGSPARKRLLVADIIALKRKMDDLGVPLVGRELVLCNKHVEDLLLTSEAFERQWYAIKTGMILDMFGFLISQTVASPTFSSTNSKKKAFGAAAAPETDLDASVAYYNKRAVQARGGVSMYKAEAKNDPKYRRTEVGFRLYHICLPKKNTGFGALVSAAV